jgi:outer membrane protein assembly factor BamE
MRVKNVVLHRFAHRIPVAALLLCSALTLSGCASWFNQPRLAAPADTSPTATAADSQKSAAIANAGAKTTTPSKLSKLLWFFSPYRPDIQQGNFVSKEMLAQLQVGQTREQVKFILGTPLMADIFHADRWDYPFYLARGDGELTTARVTIFFKDDKLARFDGGNLPTEREYIDRIAGPSATTDNLGPRKNEQGPANMTIKRE